MQTDRQWAHEKKLKCRLAKGDRKVSCRRKRIGIE